MKPSVFFSAQPSADGKSIHLSVNGIDSLAYFVGHSGQLVSNTRPGEKGTSFIFSFLTPVEPFSGIVVFRVYCSPGRNDPGRDLILLIRFKDGKIFIDLEKEYIPCVAMPKIVWIERQGYGLRVLIDGRYYASVMDSEQPDLRHVPNVNLLVSHLFDEAAMDDVIAAADNYEADVRAKEQEDVKQIVDEINDLDQRADELVEDGVQAGKILDEANEQLRLTTERLRNQGVPDEDLYLHEEIVRLRNMKTFVSNQLVDLQLRMTSVRQQSVELRAKITKLKTTVSSSV